MSAVAYDHKAYGSVEDSKPNTLLRFITCGSVDDGKSTLIGRILHDTGSIYADQMDGFEQDSKRFGTTGGDLDFALLVDGLSAEREQGITIDVAYRYFSTSRRSFIIADTPGHEQYTRNMATGASQAELAIILIDARKGVLPQTRRHSFITSLVGIRSVVVAVNKMDLVDYSEDAFNKIVEDYRQLLPALAFIDVKFIPCSAKLGDNLASLSLKMPWYQGPSLLDYLETVTIPTADKSDQSFSLPVQWVNRPNLDFRGFCGTIASGEVHTGMDVISLPSGRKSRIKAIYNPDGLIDKAEYGDAVTVTLEDEIDASRGDVLVAANDQAEASRQICADILWLVERPAVLDKRLLIKLASAEVATKLVRFNYKVDIHSYAHIESQTLEMNEIGNVVLNVERPVIARTFEQNKDLGAFILIDPVTNETIALGLVRHYAATPLLDEQHSQNEQTSFTSRLLEHWLAKDIQNRASVSAIVAARLLSSVLIGGAIAATGAVLAGVGIAAADFFIRPFIQRLFSRSKQADDEDLHSGAGI